jgi:hypothetical protein
MAQQLIKSKLIVSCKKFTREVLNNDIVDGARAKNNSARIKSQGALLHFTRLLESQCSEGRGLVLPWRHCRASNKQRRADGRCARKECDSRPSNDLALGFRPRADASRQ